MLIQPLHQLHVGPGLEQDGLLLLGDKATYGIAVTVMDQMAVVLARLIS
jgi:hypothetical protein